MNRLTTLLLCLVCAGFAHGQDASYGLSVEVLAEHDAGLLAGQTTYRIYMDCVYADDVVSSVSGDAIFPMDLTTTTSFYQDELGAATPNAVNPLLFGFFPDLQYDSWVTVGIFQQPDAAMNEAEISTVESPTQAWVSPFETGGNIVMDDATGGAWFVTQNYSNGVAGDDLKVLLAQLTTDGEISGTLLVQVFEHGVGASDLRFTATTRTAARQHEPGGAGRWRRYGNFMVEPSPFVELSHWRSSSSWFTKFVIWTPRSGPCAWALRTSCSSRRAG